MSKNVIELKEDKELKDIVDNIRKLQEQIDHPDRAGMISAIQSALSSAPAEITSAEFARGNTKLVPWDAISNEELYAKLSLCADCLRAHGVAKIGEKAFENFPTAL